MSLSNLESIAGRKIRSAASSLSCFTIAFEDGTGIVLSAVNGSNPLKAIIVDESELPTHNEAVCSVDWSWILGSSVREARLNDGRLSLQLEPAGPLLVFTGVWQGSPYLAFKPYKP